jgi:hypothetical protein
VTALDASALAWFWARVTIVSGDGCWLWKGSPAAGGYGRAGIGSRKTALAHRVAYEIVKGDVPDGMCVLHHCDVRLCVNPAHLFVGTRGDNARDMAAKGRQYLQRNPQTYAGDRHWKRRHPELIKPRPIVTCSNCSRAARPSRRGRCTNCSQYFRRHGRERPIA